MIVDEVQTGMATTGKFWAHEHWDLPTPPDFVLYSKKMGVAGFYHNAETKPSTGAFRRGLSVERKGVCLTVFDGVCGFCTSAGADTRWGTLGCPDGRDAVFFFWEGQCMHRFESHASVLLLRIIALRTSLPPL